MPNKESFDESEWSPQERARLDALTTHRVPPAELAHKTARALRERGLLHERTRLPARLVVGLLLAASVVFAVGALVGYAAANRQPVATPDAVVASKHDVAQIDSPPGTAKPARHVVWY